MRTRVVLGVALLSLSMAAPAFGQEPEGVSESYSLAAEQEANGSFRVQGMEIGDALRLLLRDEGIGLVLGPEVTGTVDMDLGEASTAEVVDLLAKAYGFSYQFRGDVLFVEKQETRRFLLELIQTFDLELPGGDMRLEWGQIRASLEQLKSPTGTLSIHELSGVIQVRDNPRILDQMEMFLNEIRERLSRQVQIEARIVEVQLEKSMETGVDWAALSDVLSGDIQGNLPLDGSVARQNTTTGDGVLRIGILKPGKVDLLVEALAERTNLRVVARPRVVSAANRPATIEVTERVPYVTKDVSREGGVAFTDFAIEFEEAGVQMVVTAQPSPGGQISMAVHPTISSVTGYTPSLPDLGPQPIVDVRETRTSMAVNDRETLVISGLIQERKVREQRGIPILQDIPILGYLFRHTKDQLRRVELVILLTPTLLEGSAAGEILHSDRMRLLEHKIDITGTELGRVSATRNRQADRLRASLAAQQNEAAMNAYRNGDPEEAVILGRRSLALLPESRTLRCNLGLFLRDAGQRPEAEKILTRIIDEEPGETAARNNLALLLLDSGRVDEAVAVLTEGLAIEEDPDRREALERNLALCRWVSGVATDREETGERIDSELPVFGATEP